MSGAAPCAGRLCALAVMAAVVGVGGQDRAAGPGTAAEFGIGGLVIDRDGRAPVRRALVTLSPLGEGASRAALTGDDGRFDVRAVAAGRYLVSAAKSGYLTGTSGAVRPGGTGVPIVLAPGTPVPDVTVELVRAGAVSGTVRDALGRPVPGVEVRARARRFRTGRRRLVDVDGARAITDDRGAYRIHGLPPGEYYVVARPLFAAVDSTIPRATEAAVQWARGLLRGGAATPPPAAAPQTVAFAPAYHPAAVSAAGALAVRVDGGEAAGVDILLAPQPAFRVAGRLADAAGRPIRDIRVWIRPVSDDEDEDPIRIAAAADGTFAAPRVLPGAYVVHAYARAGADAAVSGRLPVAVAHGDVDDIRVVLHPTRAVFGEVRVDGAPPPDNVRVPGLSLFEWGVERHAVVPRGAVGADGAFAIAGVAEGAYRVSAPAPAGWALESIDAPGGLDVADRPLDVAGADVGGLVVRFTTRPTRLSGAFLDALGRPASAYFVVVFSADRAHWTPGSRRVEATRPAADGSFAFTGLPAGEYRLAALLDADDDEWRDPERLRELLAGSIAVTLAAGEHRRQDIRVVK